MISYEQLPLGKDILQALSELNIDYVFQPIFYPDGKTVFAREALMRPQGKDVVELIDEYLQLDQLHIIELATVFGAMQKYAHRGYTEWVAINSFPSECMTMEEAEVFQQLFGDIREKIIIEMLEYPELSMQNWNHKNQAVRRMDNLISIDDYGTGINDHGKVELLQPDIVKLDRSLISNIDQETEKQEHCSEIIQKLHAMKKTIVAEGIETKGEFEYLVASGVDLFQGYYLARPM